MFPQLELSTQEQCELLAVFLLCRVIYSQCGYVSYDQLPRELYNWEVKPGHLATKMCSYSGINVEGHQV